MKKIRNRWRLKRILAMLAKSDDDQLECVIRHILHSYKKDYPDTECVFICLPRKDWEERGKTLESVCSILMNQKTDSLG